MLSPRACAVLQIKDAQSIFMEVEEEEYAKLVAKRRQDEFVEDDGDDLGYKDDGEEAWNRCAYHSLPLAPPKACSGLDIPRAVARIVPRAQL